MYNQQYWIICWIDWEVPYVCVAASFSCWRRSNDLSLHFQLKVNDCNPHKFVKPNIARSQLAQVQYQSLYSYNSAHTLNIFSTYSQYIPIIQHIFSIYSQYILRYIPIIQHILSSQPSSTLFLPHSLGDQDWNGSEGHLHLDLFTHQGQKAFCQYVPLCVQHKPHWRVFQSSVSTAAQLIVTVSGPTS